MTREVLTEVGSLSIHRASVCLETELMPHPKKSEMSGTIQSRIATAKEELRPQAIAPHPAEGAQLAWRMAIDLVAGIGVGAAIGYGLGSLIGYLPILLAAFTLLGFAAGVNLMMRSAREFRRQQEERSCN